MKDIKQAALEYLQRDQRVYQLVERDDGFFEPPANDRCPLCSNARWSSSSGAHLKSVEHTALKYGLKPKDILAMVEQIHASRASDIGWKQLTYADNSYLRSSGNFVWLPGEVTTAECDDPECDVPGNNCSCGLYFFWSPIDAINYMYGGVTVKCKLGGKIIEATKGCKANSAVIIGIVASEDAERDAWIAEQYNVPVITDIFEEQEDERDTQL